DQASLATIYSIMAVVGKALHYENAMDLLSKASNLVKEKYGDSAMENLSIYEAILQISRLEPCILAFAGSSRSAIDMKKLIINAHADTPQAISKKRARLVHFSSFFALYNVAFGNFEEICGSQYTEEPFSEFQTMGLICGYFILADLCASHWLTETAHYYHDEVLKCTRRIRGEDDQALPTECLSIGLLYLKERNWTSAAESLEKALKKSKKSKNSKMTLLILGQLAFAYESIGMHDKKILCMEEIERIKRADSSFNERIIIQSHIDSMLNGSIETLKWMKHMLVIRLGKGTPILANIYVAFMNFYFRAGDLRACLWYINKALGLAFRNKIPETDMKILEIYSLLAPVYDKLCESEKAITWYEFIIAHYEKLPYKNRELCDEWTHALEYIRRKERILIDELAVLEARPDSAKTAGNRYEIAEDYFSLGYYSKAVAPFEWCIENLRVNEKPEIIFALAEIHYKLGITYTALGDSTKALSHLKDGAIPLLANIDKNVEQVRAYWAVAEIYEKSDPEQARAYRRLAKSLSSQMQQKLGMCNAC
ncbi:MAG: hypothetical protein P4L69_22550, partial [Desulfosporosinus sp.]|nr:hypothetical protein [Desulfosporosinus sp.]